MIIECKDNANERIKPALFPTSVAYLRFLMQKYKKSRARQADATHYLHLSIAQGYKTDDKITS